MISCEKAALICSKKQYKEASWRERFQLLLHLVICKTCTAFSKKNAQLTSLCEKAHLQRLTEKEKREMKVSLQDKG